jgi:hypothetical protein
MNNSEDNFELKGWRNKERKPGETIRINNRDGSSDEILAEEDRPKSKSRRSALKKIGIILGVTATGVGVNELLKDGKGDNKEEKIELPQSENKTEHDEQVIEKKEINEIKDIADKFLETYHELSKTEHWPPREIVNDDLYIAQQLQESGYDHDAVSRAGAVGVMQNMAISIKDTVRYLNILSHKTDFNYDGSKDLSEQQIRELMDLFSEYPDYSRAFGKIYMCALWDQKNGYGVGKKPFEDGNIKETQRELLGSYNGGFRRVKNKPTSSWPKESSIYAERILNYIERIKNIRNKFKEIGLILERENYAVALIAHEMDKPKSLQDKYMMLDKYSKLIKDISDNLGRDLNDREIYLIFNPDVRTK